ncbi:sphingosine N-acyltransferase protein [Trichomonas vaginalis G3]|nr:sphingosine N-acyltransferase protein [Trichomonas vaginalis G3]KAI5518036.1 sphingosine N-acyltransferase protein [Trichomonas vaginalis G3]
MSILNQLTSITRADIPFFLGLITAYSVFRWFLVNKVFATLGRLAKVDPKRLYKFSNRCFDLLHYSSSAIIGLIAVLSRPYAKCMFWSYDCADFYMPTEEAFQVTVMEKIYVLIFFCYYIVDVAYIGANTGIALIAIHHVATLSLVFGSIILQAPVVCVIIMILHDVVDVPLYTGKICAYLGYIKIKDFTLVSFAILCTWFRMINYPLVANAAWKNQYREGIIYPVLYRGVAYFLWVLFFCHCCWFYDILKAVLQIVQGNPNAIRDNRSD